MDRLDLYKNNTLSWDEFASYVREIHKKSVGQPACRRVVAHKHKEEDYFYANPYECLVNTSWCVEQGNSRSSR